MSSFRSDVSSLVNHSLAEFSILRVAGDGIDQLGEDATALLRYALSKGEGKRLPMRKDLAPSDMKDLLPNVLILEPQLSKAGSLDDIIVRLIGTNMVSFYGQVTGQSLRKLADPMAAQRGFECVLEVLKIKEPVVGVSAKTNDQLPYFQVTVLFIPLVDTSNQISQIFVHVAIDAEDK